MALPNFFIAGAAKAGTTSLHAALSRHPQLYLSRVKEPKFFLTEGPPPCHGGPGDVQTYSEHVWRCADYEALFAPTRPGVLTGEATPFYLYDLSAQRRMAALVPDAKLILTLRDPIDRAHSNWGHLWAAGLESESDFLAACRLEARRRAEGWAHFWHYLSQGRYGAQLQHLLTLYPRRQVHLLRYRDLRDNPGPTLRDVCAFLGVDPAYPLSVPRENVSPHVRHTPVNTVLRGMLRGGGHFGHHFPRLVRKTVRAPLLTMLQREHAPRPMPTPEQRSALLEEFAADIALLAEVSGESYDDWLVTGDAPVKVGA